MTTPNPSCHLCGQTGNEIHSDLRDHLCGSPGQWTLKRCPDCGLVWLDPPPTKQELAAAYHNYYTHQVIPDAPSFAQRLYRQLLSLTPIGRDRRRLSLMYLDQVPPGRLLDIGCGNGQRLLPLRERGWDVTGQEVDQAAAMIGREQFGLRIVNDPVERLTGPYDAVVLNHVIEHVPAPIPMLQQCHRLLRRGGMLVVTTPNINSYGYRKFGAHWSPLDPPRHLYLFTPSTLSLAAKLAGFKAPDVSTTSARAVGIALRGGATRSQALWFQLDAYCRARLRPFTGEECVLQASR